MGYEMVIIFENFGLYKLFTHFESNLISHNAIHNIFSFFALFY